MPTKKKTTEEQTNDNAQSPRDNIASFAFKSTPIPMPKEILQNGNNSIYVPYGEKQWRNIYPEYLLMLYMMCPSHANIINSKVNHIIGNGLKISTSGKPLDINVNPSETLNDFVRKVIKDYLIFGYFAVEVQYNKLQQPVAYHHVPAHHVRTNEAKTHFWVSKLWRLGRIDTEYCRWKPELDPEDGIGSRMFFFDGYTPSLNRVYNIPEYHQCIESIEADMAIRAFNRNNVENRFSVRNIMTVFGMYSPQAQKEFFDNIRNNLTGPNGDHLMVNFQPPTTAGGEAADVKQLNTNDWDKVFIEVSKSIRDDIYAGHGVVSPMIFGLREPGQLNGSSDAGIETLYQIFKNTYVTNQRTDLESAFNWMFMNSTLIKKEVEFDDASIFTAKVSEDLKQKIMTLNELREEAGLPPLPEGDKLLSELTQKALQPNPQGQPNNPNQPQDPNADPNQQDPNQPKDQNQQDQNNPQGDNKKFASKKKLIELTESDFERVSGIGTSANDYELLGHTEQVFSRYDEKHLKFDAEKDIANYIIDNEITSTSIKDLAQQINDDLELDITEADLKDALNNLDKAGVISVTVSGGKVKISPASEEPQNKIEVRYRYSAKPDMGEDIIPTSRPFCRKLIDNDKLYTREDIQTMSSIFGYDIFKYGGGFYRDPDTGEVSPSCRHKFYAMTVRRKK